MPFHKRTVGPRWLCRLGDTGGKLVPHEGQLFSSLEEVWCHTLANVLRQLSDLSGLAAGVFLELEDEAKRLGERSARAQLRLDALHGSVRKLQHKNVPISSLDEESKWTVHYTAPWHQQENVFLPSSRPACVEDLHRQAKINLKTVLRECDKLRKDGLRSSQYYSQAPAFSTSTLSDSALPDQEEADKKSTLSSIDDERLLYCMRYQNPLLQAYGIHGLDNWSKTLPLPTPEEKMRRQAQAVPADIIPINITGENFDRHASIRRSLVNTDTLRRAKKVRRRKTITGVPDNIQKELGTGEICSQSICTPGQYSTLGREGTMNSAMRRIGTRDTSCQTEEIKIIPPAMRRIRAQKGQGIASQMGNLSSSPPGSSSTISSSAGVIFTPQINRDDQSFHSLPRQAPYISSQVCGTPFKHEDYLACTLPRQISKMQIDETLMHFKNVSNPDMLRFKPKDVRYFLSSHSMNDSTCVGSSHSITPNSALHPSAELVETYRNTPRTTKQPLNNAMGREDQQLHSYPTTTSPTRYDSAVSLSTGTETDSQCSNPESRKTHPTNDENSVSNCSYGSMQSCTGTNTGHWVYNTLPKSSLTSSCSTPINHMYSSLERPSSKTDSCSLYSMDNDGYYTSMHLDSGLKSHSYSCISSTEHSKTGLYNYKESHSQDDRISLSSNKSLTRSISLRKSKKPPLPPTRTDSLRRKPNKSAKANGSVLNETLIASLQESLQLGLKNSSASSPPQSPSSDYENSWMLRPRSQSSLSAGSSGVSVSGPNVYSICPVTPSQSDNSSLRSDYTDSWAYSLDCSGPNSDQLPSADAQFTDPGGTPKNDSVKGLLTCSQMTQDGMVAAKTNMVSSPDKINRLTSPSSGYSSQSNTPTAGNTLTSMLRAFSPGGPRPKPKVPERKSSLLSSVSSSSSSTSLSSCSLEPSKSLIHIPSSNLPTPPPLSPAATLLTPTFSHLSPLSPLLHPTVVSDGSPNLSSSDILVTSDEIHQNNNPCYNTAFSTQDTRLITEASSSLPSPHFPPAVLVLSPTLTHQSLNSSVVDFTEETSKPTDDPSVEPDWSQKLLITPTALQMVRLRSVKRPERLNDNNMLSGFHKEYISHSKPVIPESELLPTSSHLLNGFQKPLNEHEVHEVNQESELPNNKPVELSLVEQAPSFSESQGESSFTVDLEKEQLTSQSHLETLQANMEEHTVTSMKNKLTLLLPSVFPLPQHFQVFDFIVPDPPEDRSSILGIVHSNAHSPQDLQQDDNTTDSKIFTAINEKLDIQHSAFSSEGMYSSELPELFISEDDNIFEEEKSASDGDGDASSSTTGSVSSKEEESGEVFDSITSSSTVKTNLNREALEDMVTPTRPRTTEDLFAAIHRSKRKVLGRRESDEERSRGLPPSPPITPTGSLPGFGSLPRQRSHRRSGSTNDSFKALLLRKGSRCETGFRMSATELLRTTDPRQQRPISDLPLDPPSPCVSPSCSRRAAEEWARSEGVLPRLSPTYGTSRYGRSRVPPSAASSRYNTRSRFPSSPMSVICEQGEAADSGVSGGKTLEDSTLNFIPVLQTSKSTLCGGGT